jgi:hypothetical protein
MMTDDDSGHTIIGGGVKTLHRPPAKPARTQAIAEYDLGDLLDVAARSGDPGSADCWALVGSRDLVGALCRALGETHDRLMSMTDAAASAGRDTRTAIDRETHLEAKLSVALGRVVQVEQQLVASSSSARADREVAARAVARCEVLTHDLRDTRSALDSARADLVGYRDRSCRAALDMLHVLQREEAYKRALEDTRRELAETRAEMALCGLSDDTIVVGLDGTP